MEDFKNHESSVDLLTKIALFTLPDSLKNNNATGKDPIEVAKAVHEALTVSKPRDRYLVMGQAWKFKLGVLLGSKTIDKIVLKELKKILIKMKEPMPE